jgi:hypothetical protein
MSGPRVLFNRLLSVNECMQVMNNLGEALARQKRISDAEPLVRDALKVRVHVHACLCVRLCVCLYAFASPL